MSKFGVNHAPAAGLRWEPRRIMLERTAIADRLPSYRSRVSNGSLHAKGVNGRSASARRFRDLVESFSAELGGAAQSEAGRTLIRNAALMALRSEEIQADAVSGRAVDPEEAVRLANASARLLAAIRRKPKRPAPTTSFADKLQARHSGVASP